MRNRGPVFLDDLTSRELAIAEFLLPVGLNDAGVDCGPLELKDGTVIKDVTYEELDDVRLKVCRILRLNRKKREEKVYQLLNSRGD